MDQRGDIGELDAQGGVERAQGRLEEGGVECGAISREEDCPGLFRVKDWRHWVEEEMADC